MPFNKKSFMAMKIYTKTGDEGNTSLLGGTKVPKSDLRIDSYGTVDELNSHLGLVADVIQNAGIEGNIRTIQDRLFTIGAALACDPAKETKMSIPDLTEHDVVFLEKEIDRMNDVLPDMKNFILPGGHVAVSTTHVARCVCRRAERLCVDLNLHQQGVPPLVLIYLNRLSDYLFVLARYAGYLHNVAEIPWRPRG